MNPVSPKTSDIMRSQILSGFTLRVYLGDSAWHWILDQDGIQINGIIHIGGYPSFGAAWRDGLRVAALAQTQPLQEVAQSQVANRTMYYIPF